MRTMLDAFAQYERALIRARTRAALAVKRSRREHTGGVRPFGFHIQANGTLVTDTHEMAAIRRARELRDTGLPLRKIAAQLYAEGHTSRVLHPQSVARAIESRVAQEAP